MHFITYAKKLLQYRVELLLGLGSALSCGVIYALLVSGNGAQIGVSQNTHAQIAGIKPVVNQPASKKQIIVEISGAVYKPSVYSMPAGARLVDLLEKAEGLSKQADKGFFYRNYNQARILVDGEKIHVPSLEEVAQGAFVEQPLIIFTNEIATNKEAAASTTTLQNSSSSVVNVNNSTSAELENLPGVGAVTAEKIISGRPYSAIEDLRIKGVVSESLFTKIQGSLSL